MFRLLWSVVNTTYIAPSSEMPYDGTSNASLDTPGSVSRRKRPSSSVWNSSASSSGVRAEDQAITSAFGAPPALSPNRK